MPQTLPTEAAHCLTAQMAFLIVLATQEGIDAQTFALDMQRFDGKPGPLTLEECINEARRLLLAL